MDLDLEALRQSFVRETTDGLAELEGALVELETGPEDHEILQRILRSTHTFKGNAGSLGLFALAELGHAIEGVVADLDHRGALATSATVTLLLEAVDIVRRALPDALAGEVRLRPEHERILQQLKAASEGEPEHGSAPAAIDAPPPRSEASSEPAQPRTVRVGVEKLDRMADLIGEIAVGRSRLTTKIRELGGPRAAALLESVEDLERLYAELEGSIWSARLVPIGPLLRRYARTIRDVAGAHCKVARLVVEGGEVEVDTALIERLRDPLTHMIRNAVGHGIESPALRRARGKDPCGTVSIRASHEGGGITLEFADDGAGMNRARIAAQAVARGICAAPEQLPEEELYRLVFEPGFSTASSISDLAGRGVGMDVVRRSIEAMHGSIRIESREGVGTTLTIRVPLTVAAMDGFLVGVGDESYVIPLDQVVECVELGAGELPSRGRCLIRVREQVLTCMRLEEIFSGRREPRPPSAGASASASRIDGPARGRQSVVVVSHEGRQAALAVDALHGESRAVIKPLSRLFRGIPGIAGSTILGNGRVALILDVAALLGEAAQRREEWACAP